MGNIVTPDQGWLPLPLYTGTAVSPYPWWLNTALAIWALLALLCCWLLLLLFLLRHCCRQWRHRQYDANRKSLHDRLFGSGDNKDQGNVYVTDNQHFATTRRRPYITAVANGGEDHLFESGSEEEALHGDHNVRLLASGLHPITVVSDKTADDIIENIEHNITKNYFINEKQNYFVQKDESNNTAHNQKMETLPGPIVTTINMAAERITDDPNWEKTNPIQHDGNLKNQNSLDNRSIIKQATAEIVTSDPSLFQQNVKYEKQPNIHTHRSPSPEIQRNEERKKPLATRLSSISDDGSTTSEMSGHDSESIYETIRVFTPKKQPLASLEDDDVYKTAGFDEVEIEIEDLVRLQKANNKTDDILLSSNMARGRRASDSSSLSSSSTLQKLNLSSSQNETNQTAGISNTETVTETIQTQQIQTSFRLIGQQIEGSAFLIPS